MVKSAAFVGFLITCHVVTTQWTLDESKVGGSSRKFCL